MSEPMTEARAREILGGIIQPDGKLSDGDRDLYWPADNDYASVYIGGYDMMDYPKFTADELEAIAWWMRNKGVK